MALNASKKILIFESSRPENPTIGGSFRSLKVVIQALIEDDWNITIACYKKNKFLEFPNQNIEVIELKHFSLRSAYSKIFKKSSQKDKEIINNFSNSKNVLRNVFNPFSNILFNTLNSFTLWRFISVLEPEYIYCNTSISNDRNIILPGLFLKKKIISHLRNLPKVGVIDRFVSSKISYVISISEVVHNHWKDNKCNFKKSCVLRNALGDDFEKYEQKIREEVFFKGDNFKIGCFSRLIKWKGIVTLIEAFDLYKKNDGDGILYIYGDGPMKKEIESLIISKNMQHHIKLMGHIDDVAREIISCSLIIAPSDEPEPLGRTVMESMYLGIPVIASAGGGHIETVTDGENGLLFKMKSKSSLEKQITKVYKDDKLRYKLANSGISKSQQWLSSSYKKNIQNLFRNI